MLSLLVDLQRFSFQEIKQVAGLQVAVTAAVIVALSSAYADITPALTGSGDIDLPPVEPEITTNSSSATLSLAKHLQSVGAKIYGAFWCSHCYEQKQMFGREAMKYLDYVECYPEGYRRGVKIAKACESEKINGFPTWIIKGEVSLIWVFEWVVVCVCEHVHTHACVLLEWVVVYVNTQTHTCMCSVDACLHPHYTCMCR